jgi:hypothetical protein
MTVPLPSRVCPDASENPPETDETLNPAVDPGVRPTSTTGDLAIEPVVASAKTPEPIVVFPTYVFVPLRETVLFADVELTPLMVRARLF